MTTDDRWKTYFLYGYGFRSEANCARCPETARLCAADPRDEDRVLLDPRARQAPAAAPRALQGGDALPPRPADPRAGRAVRDPRRHRDAALGGGRIADLRRHLRARGLEPHRRDAGRAVRRLRPAAAGARALAQRARCSGRSPSRRSSATPSAATTTGRSASRRSRRARPRRSPARPCRVRFPVGVAAYPRSRPRRPHLLALAATGRRASPARFSLGEFSGYAVCAAGSGQLGQRARSSCRGSAGASPPSSLAASWIGAQAPGRRSRRSSRSASPRSTSRRRPDSLLRLLERHAAPLPCGATCSPSRAGDVIAVEPAPPLGGLAARDRRRDARANQCGASRPTMRRAELSTSPSSCRRTRPPVERHGASLSAALERAVPPAAG